MLFLFFTTAQILVFLKAFLMNFDSNSLGVSSLKIASILGFNSSAEPGKITHLFVFVVCLEREHSQIGRDSFFICCC